MPDRIFIVHGMGYHGLDWHKPVEDFLSEFYSSYCRAGNIPFNRRFKIIPVSYDHIFRDILATWNENASELIELGSKFGTDVVEQLIGWTEGADAVDKNFFWTHAFDVVFYRMFRTVREAVKVHVGNLMFQELRDLKSAESWSIIGHSLGSIVVHDTMHAWHTQPFGDNDGRLSMHFRPRLIMMIANVSRILQTEPKVLGPETRVKPGGVCDCYLNVYHPLDPFTLIRPFKPVLWPDQPAYESGAYRLIEVDHIQQCNVHDFVHYLRHPNTIVSLFRQLLYSSFVTQEKEADYRSAFKPYGELTDSELINIKKTIEDVGSIGLQTSEGWEVILLLWERIRQIEEWL